MIHENKGYFLRKGKALSISDVKLLKFQEASDESISSQFTLRFFDIFRNGKTKH